ncbi:hypothetical protein [Flavobacterium sp. UMI-01]|uniref:hypothetical protein n=1 Tax=Flavobacterium sp. UMI-01 TaxID=1441053 RepID=UPI001C7D0931|nr:hypothetical protein [Flavobacterium sp. UMI-01]GIZ08340.1 hypothetical protein FUMI01_10670 [Flavobacterium sp. UMI-01]
MAEFKGTKGKWIYNKELQQHSGYRIIVSESNKIIHKSENKNGLSEEEIEANAKLIASAPELLETLTKLHQAISSGNIHSLSEWNYKAKVLTYEILKP